MNQFVQLPIRLLQSKNPLQVLTYAIIDNQKTTHPFGRVVAAPESYISYDKMEAKYGISKKSAIKAVNELAESGLLNYRQENTGTLIGEKVKLFNVYSFPKKLNDFKEIDNTILTLDLSSKEKGVLLMMHLLTIDTNEIIISEDEMAELLGMTKRTLVKYIKLFTAKNLLFKGNHYYTFNTPNKIEKPELIID